MSKLSIERLQRITFYSNLYVLKSSNKKWEFAFTAKEKEYGFEEIYGVFFLDSWWNNIKSKLNIPFFHNVKFVIKENDNLVEMVAGEKIKIFY